MATMETGTPIARASDEKEYKINIFVGIMHNLNTYILLTVTNTHTQRKALTNIHFFCWGV